MKKISSIVRIVLSFVVVFAFFSLELLLGVETPINKTMEVENISLIMEEIDIERIFRDEKGVETAQGTRIYHYFSDIGLPREDVDEVVRDKAFKKIIGSYLGSMFMNAGAGTEVIYPAKSELVEFIHNNYDRFKNVTEFPEEYDQEEITKIVDDNYKNVKYELDELAKDIRWDKIKNIDLIQKIMSTKTILIIGGLTLCVVSLMILRKSLYIWLKWISIPTLLNGLISTIGSLVGADVIKNFVDFGKYDFIINPIIDSILKNMRLFGVLELVLGVVALIIYFAINSIVLKSKKIKVEVEKTETKEEN